nr:MAG TPA: hypothetical protein [Microviridae sp.]
MQRNQNRKDMKHRQFKTECICVVNLSGKKCLYTFAAKSKPKRYET